MSDHRSIHEIEGDVGYSQNIIDGFNEEKEVLEQELSEINSKIAQEKVEKEQLENELEDSREDSPF